MRLSRNLLIALPVVGALLTSCVTRSAAQLPVFDPANYQENLLSAVRALEQINNQVRQLQNQVLMLQRMDQNLVRLGSTISPDLQRTLADIQAQLRAGEGIALRLQATQSGYEQLFPRQLLVPACFGVAQNVIAGKRGGDLPPSASSSPSLCKGCSPPSCAPKHSPEPATSPPRTKPASA